MHSRACRQEAGFTYLGLLAALAIMGLMLTMASRVWSVSDQRDKEQELLYIGEQFRMAIARYYAFGRQYPLSLQDLLTDDRFPVPRRHLRQLYRDPFTGEANWQLIMDPTNVGITGVASQSKLVPIKRAGFNAVEVGFADRKCYCDWQFTYSPPPSWARPNALPASPGAPQPVPPAAPHP